MKQVNHFEWEQNGKTIVFNLVPSQGNETEPRYGFEVKDDAEVTEKLMLSVKNKRIMAKWIPLCAKALFEIIEKGTFTVLISEEERLSMVEEFEAMAGEYPLYDIKDIRTKNNPLFSATLTNNDLPNVEPGQGRTKDEARARALKNFFTQKFLINEGMC
jgi:hypothetical protein